MILICKDHESFASGLMPRSLKEVTRSTEPNEVERRGKLSIFIYLKTISLVLEMFICMLQRNQELLEILDW